MVAGTLWGCYEAVLAPVLSLNVPLDFHSLVLAMVDATRDALENMDTSLEDVVGTVVFLLVAVAKVVSARDALEIMGPSRRCRR